MAEWSPIRSVIIQRFVNHMCDVTRPRQTASSPQEFLAFLTSREMTRTLGRTFSDVSLWFDRLSFVLNDISGELFEHFESTVDSIIKYAGLTAITNSCRGYASAARWEHLWPCVLRLSFRGGRPFFLFRGITRNAKLVHHNTPSCLLDPNVDKNITRFFGWKRIRSLFSGLPKILNDRKA